MRDGAIPEIDRAGLRRFGLVTGAAVALLFGAVLPWLFGFSYPLWPWIAGAALGLWALAAPATLRSFYRGWMGLALVLNRVTTPLVLGLVFFFVFLPVGLVMRLVGYDPMRRSLDDGASYRVPADDQARAQSMENPF